MQQSGSQDIRLLFQATVIEEIVKLRYKVRTTEEEERLFCARSWMGLVLCIPIVCPRRIESSNQMRFRNIRPPWVRVDFQPQPKRITTLAMVWGKQIQERTKKLKRPKKKKTHRVNEDKSKYRAWSNHFVFRECWLMCHSSFQLVKGLIAKEEWIIWVWEPKAAA